MKDLGSDLFCKVCKEFGNDEHKSGIERSVQVSFNCDTQLCYPDLIWIEAKVLEYLIGVDFIQEWIKKC